MAVNLFGPTLNELQQRLHRESRARQAQMAAEMSKGIPERQGLMTGLNAMAMALGSSIGGGSLVDDATKAKIQMQEELSGKMANINSMTSEDLYNMSQMAMQAGDMPTALKLITLADTRANAKSSKKGGTIEIKDGDKIKTYLKDDFGNPIGDPIAEAPRFEVDDDDEQLMAGEEEPWMVNGKQIGVKQKNRFGNYEYTRFDRVQNFNPLDMYKEPLKEDKKVSLELEQNLRTLNTQFGMRDLLGSDADPQMFTGGFARTKKFLTRYLAEFGLEDIIDENALARLEGTERYEALAGQAVGSIINLFGAGTGLSDADREYAQQIAGADIKTQAAALRKILYLHTKNTIAKAEKHNADMETAYADVLAEGKSLSPWKVKGIQRKKEAMERVFAQEIKELEAIQAARQEPIPEGARFGNLDGRRVYVIGDVVYDAETREVIE